MVALACDLAHDLVPSPGRGSRGVLPDVFPASKFSHRADVAADIRGNQSAPQLLDVFMENAAQFRENLPDLILIYRRQGPPTQCGNLFFESHDESRASHFNPTEGRLNVT